MSSVRCWLGFHEWVYSSVIKFTNSNDNEIYQPSVRTCHRCNQKQSTNLYHQRSGEAAWYRIQ